MELPRNKILTLNAFEFGFMYASISEEAMKRMEKECPMLWLQLQINFVEGYAKEGGHPFQKQAKKDLRKYQGKLKKHSVKILSIVNP